MPRLFLTSSRRLSFFSVMARGDLQGPRQITDHLVTCDALVESTAIGAPIARCAVDDRVNLGRASAHRRAAQTGRGIGMTVRVAHVHSPEKDGCVRLSLLESIGIFGDVLREEKEIGRLRGNANDDHEA